MAFEAFPDATRVLAVLGKRLARYGLTLHPEKTRLIDFRFKRPEGTHHPAANGTTFDFLGFTHVWGKSRKGVNVVRQVTAKGRYARALAAVTQWCRDNRHRPIAVQHAHLSAMMRGHYAYYGVTGNSRRVRWYAHQGCADLAAMAVATGSSERLHMEALVGVPEATPAAATQDHPSLRCRERSSLLKNRMRGAIGEADASLPVQVWSVQSLASRTGASLAGGAATRRSKRRQRLAGVWDRLPK